MRKQEKWDDSDHSDEYIAYKHRKMRKGILIHYYSIRIYNPYPREKKWESDDRLHQNNNSSRERQFSGTDIDPWQK